ncbi:BTAD domain-containing putative transcriptional regulator [Amycolatopsis sp. QT-25]|uniref:AfsR/SARP family transcriptional regulator n=1 Tax=Amycolatopsis sp. QT-25 TaxID=3034022 RepID=UPI0023EE09E0|nr:BTAD domain-containing putative transcriptional regulator [Amycolatopsis sp. QT-25]WET81106.1 BTAD domain-containing putative transcriptional regulator [Amycolatopsis sp. QT-25]
MVTELRVLGQVELRVDGRMVEVGHARQRCVLAVLLVEANRVVTMEQLLDRVWADRLPYKARQVASNYVSRLRQVLTPAGDVAVVRRGGGYVLEVDPEAVDLLRFRHLVQQARDADDVRALVLLEEATGLWRGEPFAGLDTQWLAAVRAGLERERVAARLDRIDVALCCGRHTEVLPELFALVEQEDVDERVAAQFMLALYRAGRTTDALAHYRQLRARLIEQLGTEPGTALRDLHQRILGTDLALAPPSTSTTRGTAAKAEQPVPRHLPAPPRWFTGRDTELDRLDEALTAGPDENPLRSGTGSGTRTAGTVLISAIGGAGGIGKTWLALAWAHRHAEQFPDGQLFVDLHGFSPTQEPMAPEVAVRRFLDALGIDPGRIPTDLDAQAALYRSLVAGRRMLIVLDNAAAAEQVVPLLPGSPACTVLITGRTRLASLIDRYGARHLTLDVLTPQEARALLAARLGADRVAAEASAVDELVELCGGYPLALTIAARDASTRPGIPLAEITAELRELDLEMLDHDTDPAASLPAVLSWSLRRLKNEQRTVFALLGIAPGPDVGLPAAASLTGLSQLHTSKILGALEDASLLTRQPRSRYTMHDLIRGYAAATAHDNLRGDVREAALRRVVDFYLHTAHTADRLLEPHRQPMEFDPSVPNCHPLTLPDTPAALAWFDIEYPCLLATQHIAATHHWHQAVWRLAWTLTTFHHRRGHRHDRLAVWQAALTAAGNLHEPIAHTAAHRYLGYAYAELELHDEAIEHLHQALTLAEHHHDRTNQAHAYQALAWACELRGDDRQALEHASHALGFFRIIGNPVWEAWMLNAVGWYSARLGDYDQARDYCYAALALYRRHPEPHGAAHVLDSLGYIEHHAGHHEQAIRHYQQALILFRDLGNAYELAETLDGLGSPHITLGQHVQAGAVWREALELYREQGRDEDAARLQRQLDDLGSTAESNRTNKPASADHDGRRQP